MNKVTVLALTLAGVASLYSAQDAQAKRPPRAIEPGVWETAHFQRAHPDLRYRVAGQTHFDEGRFPQARANFVEAARWGDKLSQAMLAEIYWEGHGTTVDRARAYAWMDLAAERSFVPFIAKRERYWAALTEDERQRALEIGRELYSEHGDEVAQPRLLRRLNHEVRGMTGSRVALPGAGRVILGTSGGAFVALSDIGSEGGIGMTQAHGGNQMSFDLYYAKEFWRADPYLQWQEAQLEFARRGIVEVGGSKTPEPSTSDQL